MGCSWSMRDTRDLGREGSRGSSTRTRNKGELDSSQNGVDVEVRYIERFLQLLLVDVNRQVFSLALRPPLTRIHIDPVPVSLSDSKQLDRQTMANRARHRRIWLQIRWTKHK